MSTLNELAAASHADATRRGCYPQLPQDSLADILDEAEEAGYELRKGSREAFCEELADVLLCTLSTMHDLDMDIDAEVARKMEFNRTRGPRA